MFVSIGLNFFLYFFIGYFFLYLSPLVLGLFNTAVCLSYLWVGVMIMQDIRHREQLKKSIQTVLDKAQKKIAGFFMAKVLWNN